MSEAASVCEIVVLPCDFERAEKFRRGHGGKYDRDVAMLVAAFARHRVEALSAALGDAERRGAEAMRERIADWLQNMTASEWNEMMAGKEHLPWAYGVAAAIRAIEIGDRGDSEGSEQ